jgi:hypothetical protein
MVVTAADCDASDSEAAAAAAAANGGEAAGVLDSSNAWVKLAAQLPADIPQQPSMVKGGQLREYQMQVRRMLLLLPAEQCSYTNCCSRSVWL